MSLSMIGNSMTLYRKNTPEFELADAKTKLCVPNIGKFMNTIEQGVCVHTRVYFRVDESIGAQRVTATEHCFKPAGGQLQLYSH